MKIKFSLLITTKNRLEDVIITLQKVAYLLQREDVECLIYDDASEDNTVGFLTENYPNITLFKNKKSKGLIHNRNYLINNCKGDYAISIDDDLHFITTNPLEKIENYFLENPKCSLISFRIFWSKKEPASIQSKQKPCRVKSFAGGANAWKVASWKEIPNYPEWYVFYGEEDFASMQLFKSNKEIHYMPEILVHHRVNVAERKNDKDFQIRKRRSLRAGWFNYIIFFPLSVFPILLLSSFWQHFKNYIFKGNVKATFAFFQAFFDLFLNFRKIISYNSRFSILEYKEFCKLPQAKIYWKPEDEL